MSWCVCVGSLAVDWSHHHRIGITWWWYFVGVSECDPSIACSRAKSMIWERSQAPPENKELGFHWSTQGSGRQSATKVRALYTYYYYYLLTCLLACLPGWLTEHWIRTRTGASVGGSGGASAHFEFFFLWTIEASNSDRSEKGYGSKHEALLMITYNVLYTQRTFEFDSTQLDQLFSMNVFIYSNRV